MDEAGVEQELADAIQDGVEGLQEGDMATATGSVGRAVRLATEMGNDEVIERLSKVCEIIDPIAGRVRVRPITGIPGITEWWEGPDSGPAGGSRVPRSPKPTPGTGSQTLSTKDESR